ncbi:sensor histidine kinase [Cecembia calidifontis]|uniref:histidine kinase n=1 Tax=Cecembia calidifontis TaxID=1187080 RepID=A0A4V2F668_9BACT|nr:HAMP domain-containing sensor histidine kinase [Cecembia calidifontis]RZS95269.1 signal transduction histidine kinase [Cecembia calidifontis]
MRLQQQISLMFTALAAGILLLFIGIVYFSAYTNRLNEFYNILEKEAITKANLLLDTQLDAETLQTIYRKNREILYEVEVAIYNSRMDLIYHDAVDIDFVKETPEMLQEISNKKKIRFIQDKWQVIGLDFEFDQEHYIITAAAYDFYGFNKLENLRDTMLVSFFLGLAIIFLIGKYFSRKSLAPIAGIIREAQNISASNLDLRIQEYNSKDELGQLAQTFNQMLERLEKSFDAQKQFVSYVAHELRTPLTAIITDLELSLDKERTKEQYRQTIEEVLSDSQKVARLASTLLDFAKASYDRSEIHFKPVRVDEVLLESSQQVMQKNPAYRIHLDFEGEVEEEAITVWGNSYLLGIAFSNLMENACKFSEDKSCEISIAAGPSGVRIKFRDKGIGIPKEEQEDIFKPFFRGKNKGYTEGTGIGLTLVQKIIQQHNGEISLASETGKGATFTLSLPKVK